MAYYKQVESQIYNLDNARRLSNMKADGYVKNSIYIFNITIFNEDLNVHNKVLKFLLNGCIDSIKTKPIASYSSVNRFYIIYNQTFMKEMIDYMEILKIYPTTDNCASLISTKILIFLLEKFPSCDKTVFVNIVEIPTQINVIAYISWKIFEESRSVIIKISSLSLNDKYKPWNELMNSLKDEDLEKWNKLSNFEKYGQISRFEIKTESSKSIRQIRALQEMIDFKNIDKYTNFIFG